MNAIKNETHLWYCDICDKTITIKTKSKHNISKSHKHKKEYGTIVKEYEGIKPDIDELNYLLNDIIKVSRRKYFHSLNIDVCMTLNL